MGKLYKYILTTVVISLISSVANVVLAQQDTVGTVQRQNNTANDKSNEKDFAIEATLALFKRQACLDFMNAITESDKYQFRWANSDKKVIGLFQDSVQGIVGCGQIALPIDPDKTEPYADFSNIIYNTSNKELGIINYLSQRLTKSIGNIYGTVYAEDFTAIFVACGVYKEKIINNKAIKNKELQSFGSYSPDFPLVIFSDSFEIEAFNARIAQIEQLVRQTGCDGAKDKKAWLVNFGAAGLSPINLGGGSGSGGGGGAGASSGGSGVAMISTVGQLSQEERLKEQLAKKNQITFGPGGVSGLKGVGTSAGGGRTGTRCAANDPYCSNPIECTADDPECNITCTKDDPNYPDCCPEDDPECNAVEETCPPGEICEAGGGGGYLQDCLVTNLVENCIPPAFNTNVYTLFTNISNYSPPSGIIYNIANPGGESGPGMSLNCVNSQNNPSGCILVQQSWNNYRTYRSVILNSNLGDQTTRPEQLWNN